jgi:hypothetical protein
MANRSNGIVVTTHKATYIPPTLNPGYGGFLPELRHQYGETYGRGTCKNFYSQRARRLHLVPPIQSVNIIQDKIIRAHDFTKTEHSNAIPGVPTIRRVSEPAVPPCLSSFEHSPTILSLSEGLNLSAFSRNNSILSKSVNRNRINELDEFMKKVNQHRQSYKSITGQIPKVKHFVVPKDFGDRKLGFHSFSLSEQAKTKRTGRVRGKYRSSNRERAMRDLHFEER